MFFVFFVPFGNPGKGRLVQNKQEVSVGGHRPLAADGIPQAMGEQARYLPIRRDE